MEHIIENSSCTKFNGMALLESNEYVIDAICNRRKTFRYKTEPHRKMFHFNIIFGCTLCVFLWTKLTTDQFSLLNVCAFAPFRLHTHFFLSLSGFFIDISFLLFAIIYLTFLLI